MDHTVLGLPANYTIIINISLSILFNFFNFFPTLVFRGLKKFKKIIIIIIRQLIRRRNMFIKSLRGRRTQHACLYLISVHQMALPLTGDGVRLIKLTTHI